jgi:ABC-2 type transport system permease protein
VFEGMRAIVLDHAWRGDLLAAALALNVAYLALGAALFLLAFRHAREQGRIFHSGE